MVLSWALFALALAGWLAIMAVIWGVLYTETKRRVWPDGRRGDDPLRDDVDESGDMPA